ncbi:MAG: hypothetical protein R3Y54_13385 [Eubacteriales bacterium]
MYIAICDNDAAQRKHLERLFNRESDQRLKDNIVLYIESFGFDFQSSISAILKYDVFLINLEQNNDTTLSIIELLRSTGSTAPIYFYNGTEINSAIEEQDVHFLIGYLTNSHITSIIDEIWSKMQSREPTIEVRTEEDTLYLLPSNIVSIRRKDLHVEIHLADGTSLHVYEQLDYYIDLLSNYPSFFLLGYSYVCNKDYISTVSFRSVILQEKHKVPLSFIEYFQLKSWLRKMET